MTNYPPPAVGPPPRRERPHCGLPTFATLIHEFHPCFVYATLAVGTMQFQCVAVVGPSSLQFRLCLGWIAEHDPLRCPQRDMDMRPA